MDNREHGALENIRVLDLTRVVAGPFCGALLGDMGADVIKIEVPGRGDDARAYGPYKNGESLYFANLNRSKRGITLNLKSEKGRELFLELVKTADVVLENFRPGVMDRLGLGYDGLSRVNDQIIYAAISGFGSYGPYSDRPGYDILGQAMGGMMSLTGTADSGPVRAGSALADMIAGLNTAAGVLAAINARHIIGHGQRVDVALVDGVVACLENAFVRYIDTGKLYERNGNAYASIAPYDSYQAKDGLVIIACGNQKLYERFCVDIVGKPEWVTDPRFCTNVLRVENMKEQKALIEEWAKDYTVEEITDTLLAAGIPAGPINDVASIMRDEHIVGAREMLVEVEHPVIGRMTTNGDAIKLMDTMPHVTCPAPTLGQHNEEVYGEILGLSAREVERLEAEGVI